MGTLRFSSYQWRVRHTLRLVDLLYSVTQDGKTGVSPFSMWVPELW